MEAAIFFFFFWKSKMFCQKLAVTNIFYPQLYIFFLISIIISHFFFFIISETVFEVINQETEKLEAKKRGKQYQSILDISKFDL